MGFDLSMLVEGAAGVYAMMDPEERGAVHQAVGSTMQKAASYAYSWLPTRAQQFFHTGKRTATTTYNVITGAGSAAIGTVRGSYKGISQVAELYSAAKPAEETRRNLQDVLASISEEQDDEIEALVLLPRQLHALRVGLESLPITHPCLADLTVSVERDALVKLVKESNGHIDQPLRARLAAFYTSHLKEDHFGTRMDLLDAIYALMKAMTTSRVKQSDVLTALDPLIDNYLFGARAKAIQIRISESDEVSQETRLLIQSLMQDIFATIQDQTHPWFARLGGDFVDAVTNYKMQVENLWQTALATFKAEPPPSGVKEFHIAMVAINAVFEEYGTHPHKLLPGHLESLNADLKQLLPTLQAAYAAIEEGAIPTEIAQKMEHVTGIISAYVEGCGELPKDTTVFTNMESLLKTLCGFEAPEGSLGAMLGVAQQASGIKDMVMGYVNYAMDLVGNPYEDVDHPLIPLYHLIQSIPVKGDSVTDDLNTALDAVDLHIPGFSDLVREQFYHNAGGVSEEVIDGEEPESPIEWATRMLATKENHKALVTTLNECLKKVWEEEVIIGSGPLGAQALERELHDEIVRFAKMAKPSLGAPGFGRANAFSTLNPEWTLFAFASLQNKRRNVTEEAPIKLYEAIQRGSSKEELEAAMATLDGEEGPGSFSKAVQAELFITHMSLDHRLEIWGEKHLGEVSLEDFRDTYNKALRLLGLRFTMSDRFNAQEAQTAEARMKILRDREVSVPGIFTLFLSLLRQESWEEEALALEPSDPLFQVEWHNLKAMYAPGLDPDPSRDWETGDDVVEGLKALDRIHPGILAASMARLLPPTEDELLWMQDHLRDSREDLLHAAKEVLVKRYENNGSMPQIKDYGRHLHNQASDTPDLTAEEYEAQGGVLDPLKPHHTFEAMAYFEHQKAQAANFGSLPILPITGSTKAPTLGLFDGASSSMFTTLLRAAEKFAGGQVQPWVEKGKQYARDFIETRLRPFTTEENTTLTATQKAQLSQAITASLQDLDAIRPGNLGDLRQMVDSIRRRTAQFDVHLNGHALPIFGRGTAHRVRGADYVQQEILRTQRLQEQLARNPGDSPAADWRLKLDKEIVNMAAVTACKTLHQLVWQQFIGPIDHRKALEQQWHEERPDLKKNTDAYDDYMREKKAENSALYYGKHVDQSFTEIMERVNRQGDLTPDQVYDAFYSELKKDISARTDTGWKGYFVTPIMWLTTVGTHRVIKHALKEGLETIRTGIQSWKIENAGADGQHRPMPLTLINQIAGFFSELNLAKRIEDEKYSAANTTGGAAPLTQISRRMARPEHNLGLTQAEVDQHLTKAVGDTFLPTITVWPRVDDWWDACGAFVKANATESTAGIAKLGNKIAGVFQYIIGGFWAIGLTTISTFRFLFQAGTNFAIKRIFNHGMRLADGMGKIEETMGSSLWSGEQYTVAMQESIRDLLKLSLEALQDESGGEAMDIDAIAAQQPQWVQDAIAESVKALSSTFINHILSEEQRNAIGQLFGPGKLAVGLAADQAVNLAVNNIVKFVVVGYFVAQQDDKIEEVLCKLVTNLQSAMIGEIGEGTDGNGNPTSMGNRCAAVKVDISNLLTKVGEVSIHKGVKTLLTDGDADYKRKAGYAKGFLQADLLKEGTMTRNAEKRRIRPNATQGRMADWEDQLALLTADGATEASVVNAADKLTRSTLGFSEEFTNVVDHVQRHSPSPAAREQVMASLAPFREDLAAFQAEVGAINNQAIADQDKHVVLEPTRSVIAGLRQIQIEAEAIQAAHFVNTQDTKDRLHRIELLQVSIGVQLKSLEEKERAPSYGEQFQQLQRIHRKMTKAVEKLARSVELTGAKDNIHAKIAMLAQRKVAVLTANANGGILARACSFFSDGMSKVRQAKADLQKDLDSLPTLAKRLIEKQVNEILAATTEGRVNTLSQSILTKANETSAAAEAAANQAHARFAQNNANQLPDIETYLEALEAPLVPGAPDTYTMEERRDRAMNILTRMRTHIHQMEVPGAIGFQPIDPDTPAVRAAEQTILGLAKGQVEDLLELMLSPHMIRNMTRRLGKFAALESLMPAAEYEKITRMTDVEAGMGQAH